MTEIKMPGVFDRGGFVGDIWFGDPENRSKGTHRWDGCEWIELPDERVTLMGLLAKARGEREALIEKFMLPKASERDAAQAIRELKLVINAAENANQDGEDCVVVMAQGPVLHRRVLILEDLLDQCLAFADRYVDVVDGSYGDPEPNEAMQLVTRIREVMPDA